jgi:hypothetical protein
MMGFRGFTAVALACAASAIGCSSSSDSAPTKFACADEDPMAMTSADQACTSCVESMCASEATNAYGSGFASGNYGGGACGSYVSCIAGCACNDTSCLGKCGAPSQTCQTALQAGETCSDQKCSSPCGSTSVVISDDAGTSSGGSGGASGSGGSGQGACDESAQGICISGGLTASECSTAGGTTMTSCPSAGLVGCCTIAGLEECFYAPQTAANAMQACTAQMGTFSTSM